LNPKPDFISGMEARGFITASALAFNNEVGFICIRKQNKLTGKLIGMNYQLEYVKDRSEIQQHILKKIVM
tara:strand:- start:93 stop:302 length:210 start_codon:yes stop_codon:yes gene_type:complete